MPADSRATRLRSFLKAAVALVAINLAVLLALLVPIELIFGNWIRPMALRDLTRFSIPIAVSFEIDTSALYSGGPRNPIKYSRDAWGLRGSFASLADVDLITVGGSTTDQRYLDDLATWQAVAQRELEQKGRRLVVVNAGVDGQSTVGHAFNFRYWFPLLNGLHPKIVLFYLGANDVLRREDRAEYDESVDATSWRVRSATYQLIRLVRGNVRARSVGVVHGRMPPMAPSDFTEKGLLAEAEKTVLARQMTDDILSRIKELEQNVAAMGAVPIFMTQTAFAWNADRTTPRGLKNIVRVHGRTMNYADVAFLHQTLNRVLLGHCAEARLTCFDMANEVAFDVGDYYDFLHNTPRGAEKIGAYLAGRLAELDMTSIGLRK